MTIATNEFLMIKAGLVAMLDLAKRGTRWPANTRPITWFEETNCWRVHDSRIVSSTLLLKWNKDNVPSNFTVMVGQDCYGVNYDQDTGWLTVKPLDWKSIVDSLFGQ